MPAGACASWVCVGVYVCIRVCTFVLVTSPRLGILVPSEKKVFLTIVRLFTLTHTQFLDLFKESENYVGLFKHATTKGTNQRNMNSQYGSETTGRKRFDGHVRESTAQKVHSPTRIALNFERPPVSPSVSSYIP